MVLIFGFETSKLGAHRDAPAYTPLLFPLESAASGLLLKRILKGVLSKQDSAVDCKEIVPAMKLIDDQKRTVRAVCRFGVCGCDFIDGTSVS